MSKQAGGGEAMKPLTHLSYRSNVENQNLPQTSLCVTVFHILTHSVDQQVCNFMFIFYYQDFTKKTTITKTHIEFKPDYSIAIAYSYLLNKLGVGLHIAQMQ